MPVQDVLTIFAVCALVANVASVVLLVHRFVALPGIGAVAAAVSRRNGEIAGLVALGATLGSLYLSEVADLVPCRFCWFQRIAMYPLAVLLIVAVWTRDRGIRRYVYPIAAMGLAVSVWHYLVQVFPSLEDATACNILNPCTVKYAWKFGFVSIPYMAGSMFIFVLVALSSRARASRIG